MYDKEKIAAINEAANQNIDKIIEALDIDLEMENGCYTSNCILHDGDNRNAFVYYPEPCPVGFWNCRTRQCQSSFNSTAIGFIRGVLSKQKHGWSSPGDKTITFSDTLGFINTIISLKDIKPKLEMDYVRPTPKKAKGKQTRAAIRSRLNIPSPYYIKRGFSPEILDKYDVGEGVGKGKTMAARAIFPLYDDDGYYFGCSGRSIYNYDPKWKHNGFEKSHNLFNLVNAKPFITESQSVILVESPNNVLRLEEAGIHNSVAIFGNNFSDSQQFLIERSGAMNLIVCLDNDLAGQSGVNKIKQECGKLYNLFFPQLPDGVNDVAEMMMEQIKDIKWNQ